MAGNSGLGAPVQLSVSFPPVLRTHILRLGGPTTILHKAFWSILSLRVMVSAPIFEYFDSSPIDLEHLRCESLRGLGFCF